MNDVQSWAAERLGGVFLLLADIERFYRVAEKFLPRAEYRLYASRHRKALRCGTGAVFDEAADDSGVSV